MPNRTRICPYCGFATIAGQSQCVHCQRDLPEERELAAGLSCPSCDCLNLSDANFCDACGADLAIECAGCGTWNRLEGNFCRHCGNHLDHHDFNAMDGRADGDEVVAPTDNVNDDRFDNTCRTTEHADGDPRSIVNELRAHSADSLRRYTELWFDPAGQAVEAITPPDIGYHVFLHASLLYRFTGRVEVLSGLRKWPAEERVRLAMSTCEYLRELSLLETAESLLADDALEADELEQLEDLLMDRDGLEEVFALLTPMLAEIPESDRESCRESLANAVANAVEFDVRLRQRPDVLSVIGDTLAGLQPHFRVPLDLQRSWWFVNPGELAREYETQSWPTPPMRGDEFTTPISPAAVEPIVSPAKPSSTDLLMSTLVTPSAVTLAAATEAEKSAWMYLRSRDRPECLVMLLLTKPWEYELTTLNPDTSEHSMLWDRAEVTAWSDDDQSTVVPIDKMVAWLRLTRPLQRCTIRLTDGQQVFLEPLESPA